MIQRKQSVYLLLTTIMSVLFLTGIIFKFNNIEGLEFILKVNGLYEIKDDGDFLLVLKTFPVLLISVLIPVISSAAIFLFRNRKLQRRIVCILIILNVLLIAILLYYGLSGMNEYDGTMIPVVRMFIPLISVLLLILAAGGIKKDEDLVKSYERLR